MVVSLLSLLFACSSFDAFYLYAFIINIDQIVIMKNLTKLLVFTARNLRRAQRSASIVQQPASQNNLSTSNQQLSKYLQEEIDSQIQPFSYDQQVQQSLKAKVVQNLKYNYEGEDPNPHKLVHRPSKGAAWGLGGQLMLASKKVQLQGLKAQTDEIVQFLQLHQVKNIYVHDFFADNPEKPDSNRRRYHILGSCFSAKHCWRTGLELKNAFNLNSAKTKLRRKKQYDPIFALLNGGKDEEWVMVQYKDYDVSLMTEEQRQAMDLEWKWNNPPTEETLDKHIQMKLKKGRKKMFQDL